MANIYDELNMLGESDRVTGPSIPGFLAQLLKHGTTRNYSPDLGLKRPVPKPAAGPSVSVPGTFEDTGSGRGIYDAIVGAPAAAPTTLDGGITRQGNAFSGTGTAQASDLGSMAHLARIAKAESELRTAQSQAADAESFASGRTSFRRAEASEQPTLLDRVLHAKTVPGQRAALGALTAALGLEGVRETAAASRANAGARLGLDLQKLVLDSVTKGATARKTELESASLEERQRLASQAKARGASEAETAAILSGRSSGGVPQALQNAILPGATEVPVFDPRTRTITSTPIQRRNPVMGDDPKGPYVMENGKKRYLTAEEQARLQR